MLTDNELWLRIRHDEQKALRIVFDRYYESLCLTAFGIIKDQDLAKEIVADVFVKLWQKRQNIEILHGLRPYLYRCVYNA
jgi:RNA polymerase sigma-70 factor (ECF subfamily)